MSDDERVETSLTRQLADAKREIGQLGGWEAFKTGDWLLALIAKSFRTFYERSNPEYFRLKYPGRDTDFIVGKLASIAARNAAIVGALTGAAVSTNEILALVPAAGQVALPANLPIAFVALAGEAVLLVGLQLQLVANIAKAYGASLDPDDPEDVLTILAFALGGKVAEEAGRAGMKLGGKVTEKAIRKHVSKAALAAVKQLGRKLGIKILQRSIIKYTVPVASLSIGASWNYTTTRAVAMVAKKHFSAPHAEMACETA